jgi:hypothetical protein
MKALAALVTVVLLGMFVSVAEAASPAARAPDSLDRVERSVTAGSLTPRQGVLLQAKLLFDRNAPFSVAETRLLAGTSGVTGQPCMTSFFKEVREVYGQLSDVERRYLASLSEDLRVIMRNEAAAAKGKAVGALPDFGLDEKVEGAYCEVNYTKSGANAVSSASYPNLVKTYIDGAVKAESKVFRAAYAEGGGKLQVYIVKDDAAWGTWIDVSDVAGTGKRKSGYIKIRNIKDSSRSDWQVQLKGTCYHEYFHGVQSAYNWESSLWFMEGTCTWAQVNFAKDWPTLKTVFGSGVSCFKQPASPLYASTYHKYSTVAWAYHLADQYGGAGFIKSYFEATENEDDAIVIQQDLIAAKGSTFGDQLKKYEWAIYTKSIRSIRSYMPAVTTVKVSFYGARGQRNSLYQTGAEFFRLTPMKGIPEATLLMNFVSGATGAPEAFSFAAKSTDLKPMADSDSQGVYHDFVASFGKQAKEVCVVVTDTDYWVKDEAPRTYSLDFITPRMQVKRVTAESPITSGGSSAMTITYDLLGTHSDQATFPVELKVIEKGPDVSDNVSGDQNLEIGKGQTTTLYFNTDAETVGTYRFTLEYRVPCGAWLTDWGLPQVKSSGKTSVVVEAPEGGGVAPRDAARHPVGVTLVR